MPDAVHHVTEASRDEHVIWQLARGVETRPLACDDLGKRLKLFADSRGGRGAFLPR
jgi:hypothetical protein